MSREDIANKNWLNASSFRIILSASLLLIVVVTASGFTFGYELLGNYAEEIAHKKVDASTSDETIASLEKVQQTMEENQGLIEKIDTLRADDAFPEFAIVDRVKAIAKRNNIKISSYTFGGASSDSTGTTTPPTGTPGQQPATPPSASGETVSLSINFASVPSYKKYLQFLYDIEQNVPKMRIKGVGVSKGSGETLTPDGNPSPAQQSGDSGELSVDPLVIEMYKK